MKYDQQRERERERERERDRERKRERDTSRMIHNVILIGFIPLDLKP